MRAIYSIKYPLWGSVLAHRSFTRRWGTACPATARSNHPPPTHKASEGRPAPFDSIPCPDQLACHKGDEQSATAGNFGLPMIIDHWFLPTRPTTRSSVPICADLWLNPSGLLSPVSAHRLWAHAMRPYGFRLPIKHFLFFLAGYDGGSDNAGVVLEFGRFEHRIGFNIGEGFVCFTA